MSGDCDLCGSYDHVETKCDAFDCRTCEDDGRVRRLNVSPGLITLDSERCPDCRQEKP